jgi:hypothetical protein
VIVGNTGRLGVVVLVVLACGLAVPPAGAAPWKWRAGFTDESSDRLSAIHHQIHGSTALIEGSLGVPVRDVTFEAETFRVHIEEGAVFLEPEIEGYPVGAFFEGRATVSFAPRSGKAKGDLDYFFRKSRLEAEPIESAYFFTLHGVSLLEQLGVEGEATEPLRAGGAYQESKLALRQLGLSLTQAFLNRDGYARGTAHVLFAPASIRTNSPNAYLLYSFDPSKKLEVYLSAFGHNSVVNDPEYRYFFYIIARSRSESQRYSPQADVRRYTIDLALAGTQDARQKTILRLSPSEGVAAASLDLTPRMRVASVVDSEGRSLEFLQWEFQPSRRNFDEYLVVDLGRSRGTDDALELTVTATGPLFDPFSSRYDPSYSTFYLAEEDNWHPRFEDPSGADYTITITIPKRQKAVAAGELVAEEVLDGKRRYEFRSRRPMRRATLYYGDFRTTSVEADGTVIEVYGQPSRVNVKELEDTAKEVGEMVRVYSRMYGPLDLASLRVAATPRAHGRGFQGLILISEAGFRDSAYAEVFLAHEVAHQWWGTIVDGKSWPEDRWVIEAFAEYSAMEYFRERYRDKPEKTRKMMREMWVKPVLRSPRESIAAVTGEKRKVKASEINALIDGANNVYTKGPLVIHTLRYYCEIRTGSDEVFWEILREFLTRYAGQQAGIEEFLRLAEEKLGEGLGWFRKQWIYGTSIPVVEWSQDLKKTEDGQWLLTVEARQERTNYLMAIPIYIQDKSGEVTRHPLLLLGETGKAEIKLPTKPSKVTLNDDFEALAQIKR